VADLHIDDFYHDAAMVLKKLYQAFPRRIAVYVDDISGGDELDEYGLHSNRYLACFSTMIWLAEQGYLSYEATINQDAIDQATLSHKGFTLLSSRSQADCDGAVVTNLSHPSNIIRVRTALQGGSSAELAATMQHLLTIARHFN
jgi:hypothetical protein